MGAFGGAIIFCLFFYEVFVAGKEPEGVSKIKNDDPSPLLMIILICIVGVVLLFLNIFLLCCCIKRHRRKKLQGKRVRMQKLFFLLQNIVVCYDRTSLTDHITEGIKVAENFK